MENTRQNLPFQQVTQFHGFLTATARLFGWSAGVMLLTTSLPAQFQAGQFQAAQYQQMNSQAVPAATSAGLMQKGWLADPAAGVEHAMSLSFPEKWRFQGEILRNVSCDPGSAYLRYRITSPDGVYSVTLLVPFFTFATPGNQDVRSCGAIAQATSAENVLLHFVVPALYRGARGTPEPLPGLAQYRQANGHASGNSIISADMAMVRVKYPLDGANREAGVFGFTLTGRYTNIPGNWSVTNVLILDAPAGQLDMLAERMRSISLIPDSEWRQRDNQITQQIIQQSNQQGQQAQDGILADGQRNANRLQNQATQAQQNIQNTGNASMNNAARAEAARHTGAVGTMDHVGGRYTSIYYFCNGTSRTTNNNPNPPGPGWYACN